MRPSAQTNEPEAAMLPNLSDLVVEAVRDRYPVAYAQAGFASARADEGALSETPSARGACAKVRRSSTPAAGQCPPRHPSLPRRRKAVAINCPRLLTSREKPACRM